MNLAEVLLRPATEAPDAAALHEGGTTLEHADLAERAGRFAGLLAAGGIGPGQRVAICAPNGVGFVVAYLGALTVGAVAVPLNPLAPSAELVSELDVVDASVVVTDVGAARDAAGGRRVVVPPDDLAALEDVAPLPLAGRADDDPAALLFTSGTAGPPKAATLTHGNLAANLRQVQSHPGLALRSDDVGFGALPFFHVFGLNVALGLTLAAGASLVIVPAFGATALEEITARGVTVLAGVPGMYQAWLTDPGAAPDAFASVRLAVSGAAPLADEVATGCRERFGLVIHQGYGLTEASPIVTTTALAGEPRPGSIGPPLPGVEVRLVDDDGTDVLVGDPGEVWVRGPNVFAGYWNDAAASERALSPDGWLRTGDIAVADADGELSIVDRTKDLVIVSGFNVFPAEVEEVLRDGAGVADVAVVGEPDQRTGEAVVAFVVPAPGESPHPEQLRALAHEHLARYKCPTRIEIVDRLPRTAVGKVLRRELRGEAAT